ncbi:hypothetical protein AN958_09980 [Leucoagaricus sp. SymC.cos]|nr:hypothetical protein AN958_09980 [Leucoagaricus sp. SymC.cos]
MKKQCLCYIDSLQPGCIGVGNDRASSRSRIHNRYQKGFQMDILCQTAEPVYVRLSKAKD